MNHRPTLLLGLLSLVLTACHGTAELPPAPATHPAPEPLAEVDVNTLRLFNGLNGSPMKWDDLVRAASEADVVFIGERHGHPIGLAAAARLWEQVAGRVPGAALSLEFFDRDEQVALDDYLHGVDKDEAEFLTASGRSKGNYPPGHRAMVETARSNGQPVIAANAPRRYVHMARTDGFDALRQLTDEQRRLFVIPESLTGGRYREKFFEMMEEHPASDNPNQPPVDPEAIYRAQNMWDATMADSILKAAAAGHQPVVQVIGQMHCDYSGGTVSRIAARRSDALLWTISMVNEWSDVLREEDQGRADCVIYVGPESEEQKR